ncbi:hypothetical protein MesoLj113c_53070 [Mesorhizobium sp. 113-3-9]|nr:hypothetical protein MesoLj113c_53070 [Mesorhizobium sp. 113-3-9]
MIAGRQRMLDILAVMDDVDHIIRLAQGLAQPVGEFTIVLNKQQSHIYGGPDPISPRNA